MAETVQETTLSAKRVSLELPYQPTVDYVDLEYNPIDKSAEGLPQWSVRGTVYFTGNQRTPMDVAISPVKAYNEELMLDVVMTSINTIVVLGSHLGATLYRTNRRRRW